MRDVPDVALASSPNHDGYIICSQGECQTGYRRNSDQTFTVIGGTSAAAPTFAGVAALANQKLGTRQGNLNPQIYSLGATSFWAFNSPVYGGSNAVPCQTGTPDCPNGGSIGYDSNYFQYNLVNGWGSIDATALLNALNGTPNPHFVLLASSHEVDLYPNSAGTADIYVTPKEAFSGNVSLTCTVSATLVGATCGLDFPTVVTSGTSRLTVSGTVQGFPTGTVTVQGTSGSITSSIVLNVVVKNPDFQLATANSSETVNTGGSTTDTLTVTSLNLFNGSVSVACNGTTGLTCSLNPTSVSLTSSSSSSVSVTISASSSATTGSITLTGTDTSGSLVHTLQVPVTVTNIPPDFTLTIASPVVSISSGGVITDNLAVGPVGGFSSDVALTCSVPSSLGTTTCTISPTTVTGGNGAALVTLQGAVLSRDRRAPLPFRHRGLGEYATFVFVLGMVFAGVPERRLLSKRAVRNALLGLLLLWLMFGAVSCGGGGGGGGSTGSGPTPLNGNVTITGTSGSITHTTTINVTVQ